MGEKADLEREKRLERVFEYATYATSASVFVSLFFAPFSAFNKVVIGLISLIAVLSGVLNYRILPPVYKGFISWDFQTKTFIVALLDFLFVTVAMIFSGGVESPYFFIYFLPIIVASIVLTLRYLLIEVMFAFAAYLVVRFITFGFWPIIDFNLLIAGVSLSLISFLASRVGMEEKLAREKVQHLAQDLHMANLKLQELDKLKDEFLSVASHELRTPMAAIKGFITLVLEEEGKKIDPKVREYLLQAYKGNERLIKLIDDLLSISRIESGRIVYLKMEFELQQVIEEVINELRPEARHKKLYLRHRQLPFKVYVRADPEKLREVAYNLLGNAIKFTDQGGVEVGYEINDGRLIVRIVDSGEGIAKEEQKLLFQKFQQLGPLLRRHPGGTGLGLYISKRYIEGMGGEIWLERSEIGKGSTFAFWLPYYHLKDLPNLGQPDKIGKSERRFFQKLSPLQKNHD